MAGSRRIVASRGYLKQIGARRRVAEIRIASDDSGISLTFDPPPGPQGPDGSASPPTWTMEVVLTACLERPLNKRAIRELHGKSEHLDISPPGCSSRKGTWRAKPASRGGVEHHAIAAKPYREVDDPLSDKYEPPEGGEPIVWEFAQKEGKA